MVLTVLPGLTEFVCPTCQLPQMLPPELMRSTQAQAQAQQQRSAPAHGIDPTKIQLPCANCKAILNVPHGLSRFNCPQCLISLAVDLSKIGQVLPSVRPPLPPEEVNEVAIEVEREEDEGGLAGETFMDYRPSKLSIGPPHPDPIVETSSLSAVQPPEPTYNLKIKDDLESSKALSCLQIETLVYASQRHLQHLPNGARAGFFLGDGAGVGKGRTIAGLIWENWQHGRRKALWISVGSDLKFDARRDLDDVGATCIEVHALNKLPYSKLDSKSVGVKEGVVFLTYSSLIASSEKGRSRLHQLVQWCGQFDGLIVFDECHKAKNLVPEAGGQPTKTGEAVLDIQLHNLNSTFWGGDIRNNPGPGFLKLVSFTVRQLVLLNHAIWVIWFALVFGEPEHLLLTSVHWRKGVGALELVAMDMKARGMYVCRTLSYKGAEFEDVEVPLEDNMMDMYGKAAEFWAELRVELLSASMFLANEKPNSSQLWRLYWANHQGVELDDFVSGPRELLLKFVEENYPLPDKPEPPPEDSVKELQRKRHSAAPDVSFAGRVRKVAKWDAESEEESEWHLKVTDTEPETESDDEFQICNICNSEEEGKKLLQCSCCSQLVHPSCLIPPVVELGGPDKVAEITGRRGMLVRASGGKGVTYQARNTKDITMEMVNMHEKQLFMDGKKLVAIISEAGSAGVSLQADKRAVNQKRRVHLTLELPWSADRAIQQFGRTHRSNQASAPEYRAGPSLSAYNYDSAYGKRALMMLQGTHGTGCSLEKPDTIQDFILKGKAALVSVGIIRDSVLGNGKESGKISGRIVDSDMHDVGRFLNRLLGLPPEIQNRLFELFVGILDLLIQNARVEGHLDSGIVDMKANSIELQGTPKTVHVDSMSGASTVLFTFTLDRGMTWESASTLLEEKQKDESGSSNNGFYESRREWMGKRHFILAFENSASGMYKIYRPNLGESIREMPLVELKDKYRKLSALEKAHSGWEDEYEVSSKQCMHGPNCKLGNFCTTGRRLQEVNVLGGLILPVWGTIEKALSKQARQSHKRIRVVRIETTLDNQRIVGLLIPNAAVESVLQDLAWVQDIE
ncbi:UNVERIFIED_CONTAM: protein FORGETTER 1 [Sesamum latifolium]|uniref:Protein FORGETTER 1 n=1 Tax=Sesamum latifolium TaxID=2727402 RepID=A0AAW2WMG7_9LAMI